MLAVLWLCLASLSLAQLVPDEDVECSSYYEPTDCLRNADCFWCAKDNPGFGKSQCLSRTASDTTCEDMECTEKFCDQNPYILDYENFYYTEGECIVHNRNCSYKEFEDVIYGWCTNRWRGGGWNCECAPKFDYNDQCESSYYAIWNGKCLGIAVPAWIVWILFFLITLPELYVDFTGGLIVAEPLQCVCKIMLVLVAVLRFVWLGLFTRSCNSDEPIGDYTGGAFQSMSTVLAVVVTILFPAVWAELVSSVSEAAAESIEMTLSKAYSYFFGTVYFIIGFVLTIMQATVFYKGGEHGPLFFDNLNSGIGAFLFFISWIWLIVSAVMERAEFNNSEKGKEVRYKNTALLISGILLLLAVIVLFIYMAVGARRDPYSYLGFHSVLEVGLAIFVFLLWVVLQNSLWKSGLGGAGSYVGDLYYNMNDGTDGYERH